MKCASCGDKIEGDPTWVDGEVYCCEECAQTGPRINDNDEGYEDYEKEYEEEYQEELDAE